MLSKLGYAYTAAGENIAHHATIEKAQAALISSPSHRRNILSRGYTKVGVGVALDENGYVNTPIMSYSVKYASAFYGPFRDAAGSAPAFGDRKSYQMDPHNAREALLEAELDVQEGADILMVKPGMAYLDVLRSLKEKFHQPVALYSVSGEYAMIQAAAAAGYIDREAVICESAVCMYRAGADLLITYFAMELAQYIREGRIG